VIASAASEWTERVHGSLGFVSSTRFATPSDRACLLVSAAVAAGPAARAAWDEWFSGVVLDDVPFEGAFYSTASFALAPTPAQRPGPPIWIGSWGSAPGLRRVARLADGWLASGYNTTPELFAQAWSDVQGEVAARGRDVARFPNGIATMWCYVTEDRARADAVLADA